MQKFVFPLLLCLFIGTGVEGQAFFGPRYGSPTRGLQPKDFLESDTLPRIKHVGEISFYKEMGVLVDLPVISGIVPNVTGKHHKERLVGTPELVFTLKVIGSEFKKKRRKNLLLTSALRTEDFQKALRRSRIKAKRNDTKVSLPAPAKGSSASKHLEGIAADISARNLTSTDLKVLRNILRTGRSKGLLVFAEELKPHHFHIVSKVRFAPPETPFAVYFDPLDAKLRNSITGKTTGAR
jgi:hypothetical protein